MALYPQGVDKLIDSKGNEVVVGTNPDVVNYLLWHPSAFQGHYVYASPVQMMLTPEEFMRRFGYPKDDGVTEDVLAHHWQLGNNPAYVEAAKRAFGPDVIDEAS